MLQPLSLKYVKLNVFQATLGLKLATFWLFRQRFSRALNAVFVPLLGNFCGPTREQIFPREAANVANVATLPTLRKHPTMHAENTYWVVIQIL
jgi:hypothetical protein